MKNLDRQSKGILIGAVAILFYLTQVSFNKTESKVTQPKTIEVAGSAEMSMIPDKIKLKVVLDVKSMNSHTEEKEFLEILKNNGVQKNQIVCERLSKDWHYYYNENNVNRQYYTITIDKNVNSEGLMRDIKKQWLNSVNVMEKTNSKSTQYRKQVKIMAIKAAKEKAKYLLESIDEKLGKAILVQEITESSNPWGYRSNSLSNSNYNMNDRASSNENSLSGVSETKIRYEVKITFTIK